MISNTTVSVTLSGVPNLAVTASPRFSGNPFTSAMSVVLTPIANAITLSLGAFAGQLINGRSFDITTVQPVSFNVQGVAGTVKPVNLSVSNFNGLLKISGDVQVS
jgi:hypothetical protein